MTIRRLPAEILEIRRDFLCDVRAFFNGRGCLEIETPLLNSTGTVDPFLDSFRVTRSGRRKSPQAPVSSPEGFLITSPEYNMKITLADIRRDIYQIAHCFREGDQGPLHTEEFLMLEWYRLDCDEFALMEECRDLLRFLAGRSYSRKILPAEAKMPSRKTADLFDEFADCTVSRKDLEKAVVQFNLTGPGENPAQLRYDELFFTIFLNRIENHLGRPFPAFVSHYPAELAALSRIENDICRRFEIYWEGIELANGYYELDDRLEQDRRFQNDNLLRSSMQKPHMEPDPEYLNSLDHFPRSSGIALGLDRLLMVLLDRQSLADVSPF